MLVHCMAGLLRSISFRLEKEQCKIARQQSQSSGAFTTPYLSFAWRCAPCHVFPVRTHGCADVSRRACPVTTSVVTVAGISRASTITLSYLLTTTSLPLEDLLAALKTARPQIRPNSGFLVQLQQFASGGQRQTLRAR